MNLKYFFIGVGILILALLSVFLIQELSEFDEISTSCENSGGVCMQSCIPGMMNHPEIKCENGVCCIQEIS